MTQTNGRWLVDPSALNEHLPIGVIVVDESGIIMHANHRAAEMTGHESAELPDRSILEFIDERDVEFAVESLTAAPVYGDAVLGPARLRYLDGKGQERWTEYWAFRCPPSFGFDGYIVTLAAESVTDNLSIAAYQIASDEPLTDTLESIARAVGASPLVATGAFLIPAVDDEGERRLDVVGPWPDELRRFVDDPAMPWHETALTGEARDLALSELPESASEAVAGTGYRSIWIRAVVSQDAHVAGVFVAWRGEPGGSSPNQERHLAEAVGVARLAFDHDEHRRNLEHAALFDQLTGLGNRSLLARDLADAGSSEVTVMYIDLDHFKEVNDEYGHDVGDLVLAAAAQRLRSVIRDVDTVYRIGGDEFIVVCAAGEGRGEGVRAAASAIADRIIAALTAPFRIGSTTVTTGASIGIAHRTPAEQIAEIVRRADGALLGAKRAGKGRWQVARPGADTGAGG